MVQFSSLIRENELWLMRRVLAYAKENEYTRFTSTLEEAWKISIQGLSDSLLNLYTQNPAPASITVDLDPITHPAVQFGIHEARKHRSRGITLAMFLGLMKYYRQAYMDLIEQSNLAPQDQKRYSLFILRFFDLIELGFTTEWSSLKDEERITELQDQNRRTIDEKVKYLTVLESLPIPILLLDENRQISNFNHSLAQIFFNEDQSGMAYYNNLHKGETFPWLDEDIQSFLDSTDQERSFEKKYETSAKTYTFQVSLKKMLDVSDKYEGIAVILHDITDRVLLEQNLLYLNMHDSLTGLYNRKFFDDELSRMNNEKASPVTLVMVDIDVLKEINDQYGHAIGDRHIQNTARFLRRAFRTSDVVARIGGDEFAVILPSTDEQTASHVINRLRAVIEASNAALAPGTPPVSLSIGVATTRDHEDLFSVLRRADMAMYARKPERKTGPLRSPTS